MNGRKSFVPAAMVFAGLALIAALVQWNTPPRGASEDRPAPPAAAPKEPELKTIRLTIHPAPEPRPALKYVLLPPQHESEQGNAAVHYQLLIDTLPQKGEDEKSHLGAALNLPLDQVTRQVLTDWPWPWAERLIHRAARQRYCDWQLAPHEGVDMGVPSLGELRRLGKWMAVYAKVLIAERRYDEALGILQAGNAMGRHIGQNLTLIQGLVGLATLENMAHRVEEWVQQRESPNLYWALTNLPTPMIHYPAVVIWESRSLELTIPESIRSRLRTQVVAQEEAQVWLKKFVETTDKLYDPENKIHVEIEQFSQLPPWTPERLEQYGYSSDLIRNMPPAQVHLLYIMERSRELIEDQTKWYGVPWRQGRRGLSAAADAVADKSHSNPFLDAWLGDLTRGPLLISRFDRKLAALRTIEAIRMYAAEHKGKLPPTLEAITAVPVPDDPMTGKAFAYTLQGEMAVLDLTEGDPEMPMRYELTIAR